MTEDPIIGEIRRVRREISAGCGHDMRRLGAHYNYMEPERKALANGQYRFTDAPQKTTAVLHDKPAGSKQE
jgi:hypothetical protein